MQLLIEKGDIDINTENNNGWTSHMVAAGQGHEAVVRLLTDRNTIDINAKNKDGLTSLII